MARIARYFPVSPIPTFTCVSKNTGYKMFAVQSWIKWRRQLSSDTIFLVTTTSHDILPKRHRRTSRGGRGGLQPPQSQKFLKFFFGKGKCTEVFQGIRDITPEVYCLIGKHLFSSVSTRTRFTEILLRCIPCIVCMPITSRLEKVIKQAW